MNDDDLWYKLPRAHQCVLILVGVCMFADIVMIIIAAVRWAIRTT